MIPLSVLDLAPIIVSSDAAQSFRNTLDLAEHAQRWGIVAAGIFDVRYRSMGQSTR